MPKKSKERPKNYRADRIRLLFGKILLAIRDKKIEEHWLSELESAKDELKFLEDRWFRYEELKR